MMQGYGAPFAIGFVTGLRSMTACAALTCAARTWAAADARRRSTVIPAGPAARTLATAAALAEMAGDKMPFAPDRRIAPSFAARLVIGAAGGRALSGRRASPAAGAVAGLAGAVAGTLLGRAARGPDSRTATGFARGLAEDAVAAGLAVLIVRTVGRRPRDARSPSMIPGRWAVPAQS